MVRLQYRKRPSGAPFLSRSEIDEIGEQLAADFLSGFISETSEEFKSSGGSNPLEVHYPLDIDLFIQQYLHADQDFPYLSHNGLYLGMMVFHDTDRLPIYNPEKNAAEYLSVNANTILIDRRLLQPEEWHRYRFTAAHEAAHGILHREYYQGVWEREHADSGKWVSGSEGREQIAAARCMPFVQCRMDGNYLTAQNTAFWGDEEWMEWQANALASALLMPGSMVRKVVAGVMARAGGKVPVGLYDLYFVKKVSEMFGVSYQAAMIRLKQLRLIKPDLHVRLADLEFLPGMV